MGAPDLNLLIKPQEFFREHVSSAMANQKLAVDDHIEFYIVNLLCEFIDPGKMQTIEGEIDVMGTPLALVLKHALEAPPAERVRILKVLGDTSLYVTGFFQDYFNRKTFNIGYYITLGVNAYENVSSIMREQHNDDHFTGVYHELAGNFIKLVDVVAEVADRLHVKGEADLLSIYDRWIHSHSERLRRLLEENGISPIPVKTGTSQ